MMLENFLFGESRQIIGQGKRNYCYHTTEAVWSSETSATSQLLHGEHPKAGSTSIMNRHESLKSVIREIMLHS
jgi:hypothetical protein